jgi:two-component system LytT family response regulator
MIRALIVDDEPLAVEKIRLFASSEPAIEIVDSCSNGREAISSYSLHHPDLIFLDIQMPEMSGFEFLEAISGDTIPGIIFITAYDQFALRAFEFHALDYLLKPFDRDRFHSAVTRAVLVIQSADDSVVAAQQIALLLRSLRKESPLRDRMVVKSNGKIIFLRNEEIDWMEAAGNYVTIHIGKETHMIRETMSHMESQLDPGTFIRIHRSTIINVGKLKELHPWFNGEAKVILTTNAELIASRSYRERLFAAVGKPL